jgi:transcriptional regulator with XRE-family HTH domain
VKISSCDHIERRMSPTGSDVALRAQFASNLRALLFKKKLRQLDLAKAIGASKSAVSSWLTMNTWPSPEQLDAIADYLEVSVYDLMRSPEVSEKEREALSSDAQVKRFIEMMESVGYKLVKVGPAKS